MQRCKMVFKATCTPHPRPPPTLPPPQALLFFSLQTNRPPDPRGLIRLADDECLCPEGNGGSFVGKLLLAAAGDAERQQRSNGGADDGTASIITGVRGERGGDGGGGKDGVKISTVAGAGSGREESSGGATRSASSGVGAWPVYTDLDNFDVRSADHCVFHITHFVGE